MRNYWREVGPSSGKTAIAHFSSQFFLITSERSSMHLDIIAETLVALQWEQVYDCVISQITVATDGTHTDPSSQPPDSTLPIQRTRNLEHNRLASRHHPLPYHSHWLLCEMVVVPCHFVPSILHRARAHLLFLHNHRISIYDSGDDRSRAR